MKVKRHHNGHCRRKPYVLAVMALLALLSFFIFQKLHKAEQNNNEALIDQLMSGDFSCLSSEGKVNKDEVESSYSIAIKQDNAEWVICDVNRDHVNELILQNKQGTAKDNVKSIIGIFSFQGNSAKCIFWDTSDVTTFLFLGESDNLIYKTSGGGLYYMEGYYQYVFDDAFNLKMLFGIYLVDIYDLAEIDPKMFDGPFPEKEGVYYYEYFPNDSDPSTFGSAQFISKEQFEELFLQMTGFHFAES